MHFHVLYIAWQHLVHLANFEVIYFTIKIFLFDVYAVAPGRAHWLWTTGLADSVVSVCGNSLLAV